MSYATVQTIDGIDLFIEKYTSGHTVIAIVIENDHGDIKDSHALIDGKLEEIFNTEEIKEIKNSDDSHKKMAELYYEYNKESLRDIQRLINISKALTTFKESHGKNWKSKLTDMFNNGFEHDITDFEKTYLKQFRNKYLEVLPKITHALDRAAIFSLVKKEDGKQLLEKSNTNKDLICDNEHKKSERFGAGFFGGVDTVMWDRTVRENNDYKTVGTIHNGLATLRAEYRNDLGAIEFAKSMGATSFENTSIQAYADSYNDQCEKIGDIIASNMNERILEQ